jgi:hypothetical protein
MATPLAFHEDAAFYRALDAAIARREAVTVAVGPERLEPTSGLWSRFRRCRNWRDLEAQLAAVGRRECPALRAILGPGLVRTLTAGDPGLVAFAAAWVGAALFRPAYRGFHARVVADPDRGGGRILLVPVARS